ncbi:MAG: tRNA (adenosine(37)-N6)-dimethylallyltransferase MiaA [Gemmatimonadota bacterium]|nr:tRNA (adenosine(37)-N6)-dimethylallyltransferase MiaA [Gemmatimonadota bacterium]MDP6801850.1 tRNA (adenosine(37)-N6)-dimethylallyltransferase MiaA [Gemmatimonadota bacterium]MDP7031576.1 tRNA (adenosine(37)-N6)-dimethylallyltransferase MiaA [Gemmatimonadota bacterium]
MSENSKLPLLPSLAGPTASGKSGVAVKVAVELGLEIVSADSRQVYRRLDAGTAKPTLEERAAAPHHLVDVVDPEETYTAARFGREAAAALHEIIGRGCVGFLVGGSGLYLRAAEGGLFEGPSADPGLRARLNQEADADGEERLHRRLADADPETAARLAPADRVRVIRAIEVLELTGVTLSEHHRRHREAPARWRPVRYGLEWDSDALSARIARRVDRMLDAGWEEEVRCLLEEGLSEQAPAFRALGYAEVALLAAGKVSRKETRDRIIMQTRRFAKRQRTWFRGVEGVCRIRIRSDADLATAAATVAAGIRHAMESP